MFFICVGIRTRGRASFSLPSLYFNADASSFVSPKRPILFLKQKTLMLVTVPRSVPIFFTEQKLCLERKRYRKGTREPIENVFKRGVEVEEREDSVTKEGEGFQEFLRERAKRRGTQQQISRRSSKR